jgi:hypothetical protein
MLRYVLVDKPLHTPEDPNVIDHVFCSQAAIHSRPTPGFEALPENLFPRPDSRLQPGNQASNEFDAW